MKKSYAYHLAMVAIVDSSLDANVKLDVLKVLIEDEKVAEWSEEREEKEERT